MDSSLKSRPVEVYNSVGGAAFFRRLLEEWSQAGLQVSLFQALSEEEYRRPAGAAGNLARRWRMYGGYAGQCWRGVRRGRAGRPLRVVTTNPFFAPALVARAAGGRGDTINLLYDLYPEALVQAGAVQPDSRLAQICAQVTRYALRECAVTVFLGERLRRHAEAAHGGARRAVVIPVGADGGPFRDFPPELLEAHERPRILYAGQMGRMHETDTLRALWQEPARARVEWHFHASGAEYRRLRAEAGTREEVLWGEALADAPWQAAMRRAQVALVTIARGAERVVMPSKTYSALVAGQAILAICPRDSDLADLVVQHDCGWVVEPGDTAGLKAAVDSVAEDPTGLWAKRCRAYVAGHRHYDMKPVAGLWMRLFDELATADPKVPRAEGRS